ncbi:MAG: ROK family protein [Pseudomonadota bacterium]|nr:ROK family protein [Pseudomonadota bacterium]
MAKKKKGGKKGRKHAYIGIDVGGTKSLFALFDAEFEVVAEEKFRSHPEKGGAKAFSRLLESAIHSLMRAAAKRGLEVKVVGVGCAGDIDMRRGSVRSSPNLPFLNGYRFGPRLARLTGAKVFVGHDVQTGLYGEFMLGAARKARHGIGIWVGTGVGGAIVIDRRLYQGATGMAGDLGHYVLHAVVTSGDPSRKEVLDNVASRTAIAGHAAALAARHRAPSLRKEAGTDVKDIKASDLAESIRKGDKAVEKLVRSRASVIGTALSNLVDFLNPDVIVLGGGLTEAMPVLMRSEIRRAIDAHAVPKAARAVKVVVAQLHSHAGTTGAAKLALDMFSDRPPIDL